MKIELTRFQTGKDANGEVVSSHSGDKILIPKRGPLSVSYTHLTLPTNSRV